MADEARWYVVQTFSSYENAVADAIGKAVENRHMQDRIFEIQIPMETVTEVTDGKSKTVERKVYPSYVFVKMILTNETWQIIRNIHGVSGFLGNGKQAIPLRDEEVLAMGMEKHEVIVNFHIGDTAKIIDGPLEGFEGTLDEIDTAKNRVGVVVSMFGRETHVDLDFDQIEVTER